MDVVILTMKFDIQNKLDLIRSTQVIKENTSMYIIIDKSKKYESMRESLEKVNLRSNRIGGSIPNSTRSLILLTSFLLRSKRFRIIERLRCEKLSWWINDPSYNWNEVSIGNVVMLHLIFLGWTSFDELLRYNLFLVMLNKTCVWGSRSRPGCHSTPELRLFSSDWI